MPGKTIFLLATLVAGIGEAQGRTAAFDLLPGPATPVTNEASRPGPTDELAASSPRWQSAMVDTARQAEYLGPEERELIREINLLRTDPPEYARRFLAPLRGLYHDNILQYPGEIALVTTEGVAALEECLTKLQSAKPAPPLSPRPGLTRAAGDQVRDQGQSGKVGHDGSDNSSPESRINRYGHWESAMAENIDYGNNTARRIVTALLIDDGVPSRGHRKNLLNPVYRVIGVAIGPHPEYRHLCVMDFAAGFQ